jgi:hypothetical protein
MRPARSPSATAASGASSDGSAGGVMGGGGMVVLVVSGVGLTVGKEETRDSSWSMLFSVLGKAEPS